MGFAMKKKSAEIGNRGGKRDGAGRKQSNPGGPAVRVSVSMPAMTSARLDYTVGQTGISRSAIVVAALEEILSQSPDRLRDAVAARQPRPAAERLPGGGAE